MKSALLVCLTCLVLVNAQGRISGSSRKCMCLDGYMGTISRQVLRRIKSEPEIHHPSIFCPKTEIILSIGTKKQCVDPQSALGKLILGNKKKQDNKRAALLTTTTSSLNHTGSSTTFHSTSSAPTLSTA